MKTKFLLTAFAVLLTSSIFVNKLNACSLDGYVGNNGTSCLYLGSDGCYHKVEHHRILFGLFQWNTDGGTFCNL